MRKFVIFFKLHWPKLLLLAIALGLIIGFIFYASYSYQNYKLLEPFQKRSMAGTMALYLPMFFFAQLLMLPMYFGMHYFFMQGGGLGKLGREQLAKADVNVHWNEVIGMEAAKREAQEIVKLLKDRTMVKAIGGKIIKGTLMLGPPGCGKTYLAKAIATECGLPMISASGSDFVGMFIGQGTAQMKSLFKQARAAASLEGGCMIFIDEIDSFARPRQPERGFGGATSHNATINQFLTELDGLRQAENNIVVIGATNASEDELDPAIIRAGRLERKIHVTKPNLEEREDLFRFYLKRIKTDSSCDPKLLARKCLGFSPSDIDSMIREASLIALRDSRDTVNKKDLSESYDRVSFGLKSNITLTKDEKIWTAYHEAGHAVIAYLEHPTNDVIKATIIPHKGSLGFISQRPVEEMHSSNREHLIANIKVSLAAYVAEKLIFGQTSSGVGGGPGSDFDHAMRVAHTMVWSLGMGRSGLVGDFNTLANASPEYLSEKTKQILEEDVQHILQTCLKEVEETLTEKKDILEDFAQQLLSREELDYDEIINIFDKHGLQSASKANLLKKETPPEA